MNEQRNIKAKVYSMKKYLVECEVWKHSFKNARLIISIYMFFANVSIRIFTLAQRFNSVRIIRNLGAVVVCFANIVPAHGDNKELFLQYVCMYTSLDLKIHKIVITLEESVCANLWERSVFLNEDVHH